MSSPQDEQNQTETHSLLQLFSPDFTFTKRQLGIILLVVSVLGIMAILGIDLINAGREGGIGPAQQLALGIMALVAVVGTSLIPLGNDTPA